MESAFPCQFQGRVRRSGNFEMSWQTKLDLEISFEISWLSRQPSSIRLQFSWSHSLRCRTRDQEIDRLLRMCDMTTAMATQDIVRFESIPSCSKLLQDPEYVVVRTSWRQNKSTKDALFAETLKADDTIQSSLSF